MKIPRHLAIIMDGNGRWAQSKARPRSIGHIKGTRVAKKIITRCADLKIPYLTLYAFSTENWLRPQGEVNLLMRILQRYLRKEVNNLVKKNIRFHVIGDTTHLPTEVLSSLAEALEKTKNCTGLQLTFALSYGSRQELTQAVVQIANQIAEGKLKPHEIDEATIQAHLSTSYAPDPDLIIRTSGEQRLSNFLLWQAAYSEFYFSQILWPDFTESDLEKALQEFSLRQRRFGGIKAFTDEQLLS